MNSMKFHYTARPLRNIRNRNLGTYYICERSCIVQQTIAESRTTLHTIKTANKNGKEIRYTISSSALSDSS